MSSLGTGPATWQWGPMPIRVSAKLRAAIRRNPGHIVLQVIAGSPGVAAEALRRSRPLILGLDAGPAVARAAGVDPREGVRPKFVSAVIAAEPGPVMWIDGGHSPAQVLLRIPELVSEQLQAMGVVDGAIVAPSPPRLLDEKPGLFDLPRTASLWLYPEIGRASCR